LNVQRFGGLEDISWRDFGAMVQNTMLGLHALAINKGDNIAIVGATTVCPGYASTWGHWLEGCRTW
jgi:long-subunit acyl-CoA synthetase (AMP-forming)